VAAEATADTEPLDVERQADWLLRHDPSSRPVLVGQIEGRVVGWASLSEYRGGRGAVRHTAEISYYVDYGCHRRGVGSALIETCLERCPALEIKTLFAILLEDNLPSIRLLEKFDFVRWGRLPGVADFAGREVGHLYYGRRV